MKKKALIITLAVFFVILAGMIASGFRVCTSVYITDDFTVSADGGEITFQVKAGSSMGFVRGYKDEGGGVRPHYLKFYSSWGGWNSSVGAKNEYRLKLDSEDSEIYVYHENGGYDLALAKDVATGEWYRVS